MLETDLLRILWPHHFGGSAFWRPRFWEACLRIQAPMAPYFGGATETIRGPSRSRLRACAAASPPIPALASELRADHEIVLEAVKQNGSALKYASEELNNDEVVLEAAKQDGFALE